MAAIVAAVIMLPVVAGVQAPAVAEPDTTMVRDTVLVRLVTEEPGEKASPTSVGPNVERSLAGSLMDPDALVASMSPRDYVLAVGEAVVASGADQDWVCDWSYGVTGTVKALSALYGYDRDGTAPTRECFRNWTASFDTLDVWLEVIPATGLGFPASLENVYHVEMELADELDPGAGMVKIGGGDGGGGMAAAWDTIPDGGYMFLQTYDRLDPTIGDRNNTHVLHIGNQDTNYGWRYFADYFTVTGSLGYQLMHEMWGTSGRGAGGFYNIATDYVGETVYRKVLRLYRDGDTVRPQYRVYDGETLFMTGADLVCDTGICQSSYTGGRYADADTLGEYAATVATGEWDQFVGMEIGNNGNGTGDPATRTSWYWSGMSVTITMDGDAWPSAYPSGREGG